MVSIMAILRTGVPTVALATLLVACGDGDTTSPSAVALPAAWPMYGGSLERRFFNPTEAHITTATVSQLVPRWRFMSGAVVTASPVVADVALPGGSVTRMLFISSWDGNFYALRANDGSLVWSYRFKTQPGSGFPQASSAAVADIGGHRLVYVGSGETMYCFDAATGALRWQFDAGSGCTTCDRETERNEVESSPAVFDNTVYFGMDVNEFGSGKGGMFAVHADTGTLRWYFDIVAGATCRPQQSDKVRRFDGFHSAQQLGLPADFFSKTPGCNFDRTPDGCGNIWSSAAIDGARRRLYITSANCNPSTTGPSTSPYDEAFIALTLDGAPVWQWRPRAIDPNDLDFGAPPNLFQVIIGGATRDVVGAGAKDGTYYLLDRDGVNPLTHTIEPYWQRNVVPGGSQGGLLAAASVGEGRVLFSTAIGGDNNDSSNYQKPTAWGLNAADGNVAWSSSRAAPSFAASSGIPRLVFMGSLFAHLYAYESGTGTLLANLAVGVGAISSSASPAVVVDGELYIGVGVGARDSAPEGDAYQSSLSPSPITDFCLAGTPGCAEAGKCNDANPCTIDAIAAAGRCTYTAVADGTACTIGTFAGACHASICMLTNPDCDDHNQCTVDTATDSGCEYQSAPAAQACIVNGMSGLCREGFCDYGQPIS